MTRFDESKVINTLHAEKAKLGKKYWYADNITTLKYYVERDFRDRLGRLEHIYATDGLFELDSGRYYLLYPYEEPPKKRMTNRQLAEWLAKGNGQYTTDTYDRICDNYCYYNGENDNEVDRSITVRSWGSEEWIEPTVDIYERDCKGVTK